MTDASQISRRSFLKDVALTGAAVAAAGVLTSAPAQAQTCTLPGVPDKWDYETDVVVVGYGGAAWFTAITALDAGAKVIILEKAPIEGGGSTRVCGCYFTVTDDPTNAAKYHMAANSLATPPEMSQAWAQAISKIPAWFNGMGIKTTAVPGMGPDFANLPGASALKSIVVDGHGSVMFKKMDQLIRDRGANVMINTPAKQLVQHPATKEILGVLADSQGKTIAVKAKRGVVLACGGFENNTDMKNNFLRPEGVIPVGWRYNTGDGIRMAISVGADLWHMNLICSAGQTFIEKPGDIGYAMMSVKGSSYIWVNRYGDRFVCENPAPWVHRAAWAYDGWDWSDKQKDVNFREIPSYFIFDETSRLAGALCTDTRESGSASIPPELGGHPDVWSKDNSAEIAKGWIKKADTIEALAKALGDDIDPAKLVATVDTYNQYAVAGKDPEYGRNPKNMTKIVKPPFYGIRIYPGIYSTCGGPRKNIQSQVLDANQKVIGRLYVAGVLGHSASHVYSTFGQNMAENYFSGTTSGANAAAEKPWDAKA